MDCFFGYANRSLVRKEPTFPFFGYSNRSLVRMEPTFPLFLLPENAIISVLKNMNLAELFFISTVSTKSKNLVASLKLRAECVNIRISRAIRLAVYVGRAHFNLFIYNDANGQNGESPADITLPVAATFLGYQGSTIQLTTPLLNFHNWLNYIQSVFCCTLPPKLVFDQGCERFDFSLLKDAIGNVNWLILFSQSTDIQEKKILKYFNAPKNLYMRRNPFEEATCEIQKIFIQNFKTIGFQDAYTLDDMLLVNSEKVEFFIPTTQKQFNRFLKHWIRGSNPRLQEMSLPIDETDFVHGEIYLKGIRCMEISEETKRDILQKHRLLKGMVQIRRQDGTTAVTATNDAGRSLKIHLIVLH
ncbi:hypothetical protein GCK72_016196 [Caenorhabditis remanei]|uniref:F-box domain-containing protein n=1 Tax=Caenorhabditis remanei TaxID=31234 RepID=A0A6A5GYH8_CAERE|nr:hypothetical protein GCK72_016196 [Caenorhabditis remanei]KAF1759729.1 hypothetical protein GCK72_016196 [Caenorhabditis remanei]